MMLLAFPSSSFGCVGNCIFATRDQKQCHTFCHTCVMVGCDWLLLLVWRWFRIVRAEIAQTLCLDGDFTELRHSSKQQLEEERQVEGGLEGGG